MGIDDGAKAALIVARTLPTTRATKWVSAAPGILNKHLAKVLRSPKKVPPESSRK